MTTTAPFIPVELTGFTDNITRDLKKDATISTAPGKTGVPQFGLYFEFVRSAASMPMKLRAYIRVLMIGRNVYMYERAAHATRTVWRHKQFPNELGAHDHVERVANAAVLRGAPMLVQLDPTDISAITTRQLPGARFRATAAHEHLYGKFDVKDWDALGPRKFNVTGAWSRLAEAASRAAMTAAAPAPASTEPY